jgi:hypothetical protein
VAKKALVVKNNAMTIPKKPVSLPKSEAEILLALDRVHVLLYFHSSALEECKPIKNDPKAAKLLEQAQTKLSDLYQHLGKQWAKF